MEVISDSKVLSHMALILSKCDGILINKMGQNLTESPDLWTYIAESPHHNQVWYIFNALALVPVTILFLLSFLTTQDYQVLSFSGKPSQRVKTTWIDKLWRPYFAAAVLYYIVDSTFILNYFGWDPNQLPVCKQFALAHHLVTLAGCIIVILPHFPWFMNGPLFLHAYLITFPNATWLNIPYGISACLFGLGLMRRPFWNHMLYRTMLFVIICLGPTLMGLQYNKCKNDLRYPQPWYGS